MRPLTVIALCIVPALVFGAASGDDEKDKKPVVQKDVEEQPHQRLNFYNWDYKDLGTTAFEDLPPAGPRPVPLSLDQSEKCPNGWLRYSDSCYWIEPELTGFAKAERLCSEKQATLFVANSLDEWDAVRDHAREGHFSWIGLVRFSHYEKTEQLPRWQTTGSINPRSINWIVKPFSPLTSGWTTYANCAAHFKSPSDVETASYTYFYPCTYLFNSICERNSTILGH